MGAIIDIPRPHEQVWQEETEPSEDYTVEDYTVEDK